MTWGSDYVGRFSGGEKQDNDYFSKRMETENAGGGGKVQIHLSPSERADSPLPPLQSSLV